jgi:hypothetical protein
MSSIHPFFVIANLGIIIFPWYVDGYKGTAKDLKFTFSFNSQEKKLILILVYEKWNEKFLEIAYLAKNYLFHFQ